MTINNDNKLTNSNILSKKQLKEISIFNMLERLARNH